jgi:hypothetical protein
LGAVVGTAISPPVTVEVEDALGSRVTSSSASITVAKGAGPGVLSGTLSRSAVNGLATFNDLTLNTAGAYELTAASAPLVGTTSASFSVTSTPGACVSLSSGDWNVAARWNCARVPLATDAVTIAATHTVTIPSGHAALAYSLAVGLTATSSTQTLALAGSTASLVVGTDATIFGPTSGERPVNHRRRGDTARRWQPVARERSNR